MPEPDYSIYYRRFHQDNEAHAEHMAKATAEMIGDYLPSQRTAHILDIGCGFGFALRALRGLGYQNLEGLERSPSQAERCHRAGFSVAVSDDTCRWLEARPAAYDFILLLDVLEHVPVDAQIGFLASIRQSLRPRGRLFLTTPNANSLLSVRWRYNDHTHTFIFTEHSLFYVLMNAGFPAVNIEAGHGIGRMPRRLWRPDMRQAWRRWFVRWCWLQIYKAELPWEKLEEISFELNLRATAEVGHEKS